MHDSEVQHLINHLQRSERRLAETIRQLSSLNRLGQFMAASFDIGRIYEEVLSTMRLLLGAEAVIVFLHEENELVIVAMNRLGAVDMIGQRMPVTSGIAGQVWQDGQSRVLRGVACLERLSPTLVWATGYQPQSMLAVPIRWQEQALGVLEATHTDPDAFDEDSLQVLETAARRRDMCTRAGQRLSCQRQFVPSARAESI